MSGVSLVWSLSFASELGIMYSSFLRWVYWDFSWEYEQWLWIQAYKNQTFANYACDAFKGLQTVAEPIGKQYKRGLRVAFQMTDSHLSVSTSGCCCA